MPASMFYPYRSEAARDRCFAYLDARAALIWPPESREEFIPTTFGPTLVRITGPAARPPLVLLHGAGGTSLMWAPNIRALSENFQTFAPDQLNEFGKTLCSRPVGGIAGLVAWLDELLDRLGLGCGVNLAGMSYGGALAAQYALKFPTRLNRLILLAPGNTVLHGGPAMWAHFIWAAIRRKKGVPGLMRWIFADMVKHDPAWVETVIQDLLLNMESMERRKPIFPPVLKDAEWHSLDVRTLFLVGEHEVIYPAAKAVARLRRVAPRVIPEIVPGTGHELTTLRADHVNRRILRFLASEPPHASGQFETPLTVARNTRL